MADARRPGHRLGSIRRPRRWPRRAHYLATFGLILVLLGGLTIATSSMPATSAGVAAYRRILPPVVWGSVNVVAGGLALASVARRRVLDRSGDLAMAGLTMTAVGSALGYVYAASSIDGPDVGRMLAAALLWSLVARVHLLISGWPEPPKIPTIEDDRRPVRVDADLDEIARALEERRAERERRGEI